MLRVYPKQVDDSARDSRSPRFHVNKGKSESVLIPSTGRDKLSPLMNSCHATRRRRAPVYVDCAYTGP